MNDNTLEGRVVYPLKSGFALIVTPPTLTLRNALLIETFPLFPDPDPEHYARVTQTPTLGGEPAKTDGRDSADYKHDKKIAELKRQQYLETVLIDACVDTEHDRQAVIDHFMPQLSKLRMVVQSISENDWEAVLKSFLAEPDEVNKLRHILSRNLPLTEDETADGRKFFRVAVPGTELRTVHAGEQPPAAGRAEPRQNQRTHGGNRSGKRVRDHS